LNGANNYSGGTNVFGGTVLAGISSVGGTSGAMGTYEVQLGANNGSNSASVLTNGPYTISNPISAGYNNGGNTTGTLTIGGNTSDSSSFSGSFIYLDGPALTIASQATGGNALTIGETVYVNGSGNQTLTFTGSGNTNVSGGIYNFSIVATGSVVTTGTGNITFSGSNSYTGGTNVSSGTLNFAAPYALPTFTGLTIGSNALAVAQVNTGTKNTLFVSGLSIAGTTDNWTGKLDLANNDMVVRGGSLTTINNQAAYGFNGGTWNNADGIVSSAAAADSTHLTALGVIQNDNGTGSGTALYNTFDGQPVVDSDILVKYTYYGDTDLNGEVDGSDYSRIDYAYENNQNSSNTQLTGWFNGDFNYDGVIDGSDYTLLDNAFNSQGAIISAEIASPTAQIAGGLGASAVPEPTALGLSAC
jgi:autotransporter-associated beta strand protein